MNERYPRQCVIPLPSLARELPEMLPALVQLWERSEADPLSSRCISERTANWLVNAGLLEEPLCDVTRNDRVPFRLTPAGWLLVERFAEALANANAASGHLVVPKWDPCTRELRFHGQLVKRFRKSAPNQERVLTAFEEQGWPYRIDDPLPPPEEQLENTRLHETIKRLNRCVQSKQMRFAGDGTGSGVCWRSEAPCPTENFSPIAPNRPLD